MKIKALLIALQFCISFYAQGAFPPNYTASYDVEKYGLRVGRGTIVLEQNKASIHYSQSVELVGLASLFKSDRIEEDSWLTISANKQVLLNKYQYIHSNSSRDRDVLIEGKWSRTKDNQLTGIFNGTVSGGEITVKTKTPIWDNFSFQLALMSDVSDNKKSLSYNIISRGRLKKYDFSLLGSEKLQINEKEYNTVKLERIDDRGKVICYRRPVIWLHRTIGSCVICLSTS